MKTSLILTYSKIEYNQIETLSTLRFNERDKTIKNKPIINYDNDNSKDDLVKQVQMMKKELLSRSYRYVDNLQIENWNGSDILDNNSFYQRKK